MKLLSIYFKLNIKSLVFTDFGTDMDMRSMANQLEIAQVQMLQLGVGWVRSGRVGDIDISTSETVYGES